MALSHENLIVYKRSLSFNAIIFGWIATWDRRHAICDQLERAAGSILENIAMASASYSGMKIKSIDYAIGSTLESAACLDLALVKKLINHEQHHIEKVELLEVMKMLVGLRRSWITMPNTLKEARGAYGDSPEALFNHEKMDIYQVSLELAWRFANSKHVNDLPLAMFQRLDELLTSILLNLAEGNGRFSNSDQQRFLGLSHEAVLKLSARLDLCSARGVLPAEVVTEWKVLLERVSTMNAALLGVLRNEEGSTTYATKLATKGARENVSLP